MVLRFTGFPLGWKQCFRTPMGVGKIILWILRGCTYFLNSAQANPPIMSSQAKTCIRAYVVIRECREPASDKMAITTVA